jgi:HEPN domain-containing protein
LLRKTDATNPRDWLFIAESDLAGLRLLAEREIAHELCLGKLAEIFEKVLKAELIRLGWLIEQTHDLFKLSGELRARKSDLIARIRPLCEALAEKYFTESYPGSDLDDANWPALRAQIEAVAKVEAIVKERVSML